MNKATQPKRAAGNYVSEWFGHRVYPDVVSNAGAVKDQVTERCPFLSAATGETRQCIKNPKSKGVCSVSCISNGPRQDWLVCPYRALNTEIVAGAIRRLFGLPESSDPFVTPAVNLIKPDVRADILARLDRGQTVFTYFDEKTGGELSIPATSRSPEFAFDVTIIELTRELSGPHIGRFGILEIQTTDFHGSYQHAVRNLKDVLRLHEGTFASTLQANEGKWLSQGVEGPNIANVFKRTFYQMMFKFQLGQHERCAGCVLAIPKSVWDSWQKHLGGPSVTPEADGTVSLLAPGGARLDPCPAWVFVFDSDAASPETPSPIVVRQVIGTDAASFSYWALDVAPAAALSNIDAEAGFLAGLSRRLKTVWPELARTVIAEVSVAPAPTKPRRRAVKVEQTEVPLAELEKRSPYPGPSEDAVKGDEPDQDGA
jgi:hypothetical protein